MSRFKNPFTGWKRRAPSAGRQSGVGSVSQDRPSANHDAHSGAEGHAFQVNKDPEPAHDHTDAHHHGAEGHAFQVNDQPQQTNE